MGSPSLAHLLGRLAVVEVRVRSAVERRRAAGHDLDDPFRGLYVSDEDVERLLAGSGPPARADPADKLLARVEARAERDAATGAELRLRGLVSAFGLVPFDLELLVVALAPDLDARFERLYGYLHDDVTRRRASIGLALELAGAGDAVAAARHRLDGGAPLVDGGLVLVEDGERPFLTRTLRVPDRVTMHLLGDDHIDVVLAPLVVDTPGGEADGGPLARAFAAGCRLCYLRERAGADARVHATAAFAELGLGSLALDVTRLAAGDNPQALAGCALREARLRRAGIVAGPVEALAALEAGAVRAFAELSWPTVLTGAHGWDPAWSREVPLAVELATPPTLERARMWRAAINGDAPARLDPAERTAQLRVGAEQIARASRAARFAAAYAGRPLSADDLLDGARAQNAAGLERLARRIRPRVGWNDLVLPPASIEQLSELAARAIHRERVLDEWGLGAAAARRRGVAALFAGESGTGKTLAAEVLAAALGVDLYAIDLSTVVDKYVGETEKNLDRIFREAERIDGVLFFDEADALFGKRSEVRDAHDRYANIEVAYLLQRIEGFEGIAVLATNLRANIDEAFTRRLDGTVDFPMPDEHHRRRLWDRCLGSYAPRAADLDLDFCAATFDLSGGSISNICVAAAFLAAAGPGEVGMREVVRAVMREYRKLGRLAPEAELGPYLHLDRT